MNEALAGGQVFLFGPGLKSVNVLNGAPIEPAFSNVVFPPAPLSGSIDFTAPTDPAFANGYVFATAFIRRDTGGFVRTDGLPVENSNLFTIQ